MIRNGMAVMVLDSIGADIFEKKCSGRARDIDEAQRLLAAALDLLDRNSLWQAAATVDLAVHQIDREPRD